ncbi:hypothetical protein RND59_16795 [Vibrio ruber]|nr:hypothetical protein [Vibrio ruber]WNJ97785.1 hypothetical protein RND59_16795 [Vibrio ruber]
MTHQHLNQATEELMYRFEHQQEKHVLIITGNPEGSAVLPCR